MYIGCILPRSLISCLLHRFCHAVTSLLHIGSHLGPWVLLGGLLNFWMGLKTTIAMKLMLHASSKPRA